MRSCLSNITTRENGDFVLLKMLMHILEIKMTWFIFLMQYVCMFDRCTPNIMSVQCSFIFTSNSRKINPAVNCQNSSTTGHSAKNQRGAKDTTQLHSRRFNISAITGQRNVRDPQLCSRLFLPILPFQHEGVLVIQGQRVAPLTESF